MEQVEGIQNQNVTPVEVTPAQQEVAQEKLLKQSEVNELVGRVKHEAYTKGMRDAVQQQPQQASSMGGMTQLTDEQIRQVIADERQKQDHMEQVKNTLTNFAQQMGAGKSNYSDFDETVANLGDMKNIPHVVQMATETGIAGDIMYELGKNPGKVASLTTLAYINPHLAQVEMRKLADSIKANQKAKDVPQANEPLTSVQPSTVGTDNGSSTISDLRNKPWARG